MNQNSPFEKPIFLMLVAGVGCFLLSFIGMGVAPWTSLKNVTRVAQGGGNPYYESDGSLSSVGRGRRIYIQEGCWHCHSQFVRPVAGEPFRYGPPSEAWESRYDVPQTFGTRRVGPDLSRSAGRHSDDWHLAHLYNPRATVPLSVMPSYRWLFTEGSTGPEAKAEALDLIAYLQSLGAPHREAIQGLVYPRLFKVTGAPLATKETLERGILLFGENCAGCHGPTGEGNGVGNHFLKPKAPSLTQRYISPSEAYSILNRGVLGSAMPSFREMPSQDIWALAEFVATLGARPQTEGLAHQKAVASSQRDAGKKLFTEKCAVCHGAGGGGDGQAGVALNPRPKDFTRRLFQQDYFKKIISEGIPGSAMPPFPALSANESEALFAYVTSVFNEAN